MKAAVLPQPVALHGQQGIGFRRHQHEFSRRLAVRHDIAVEVGRLGHLQALEEFMLCLQHGLKRLLFDESTRREDRFRREDARDVEGLISVIAPTMPPVGNGVHQRAVGILPQSDGTDGNILCLWRPA